MKYTIIDNDTISDEIASCFLKLLIRQNKVKKPGINKIKQCRCLCICKCDGRIIGIGAIKKKTKSDFFGNKAKLQNLEPEFSWELGYCFTDENYRGKGISSTIVGLLLDKIGSENLMASTEICPDNPMIKILKSNAFVMHGAQWRSSIHGGSLGLFLRFKEAIPNK